MKISYKVPLIATTIILLAFAIFSFWQYITIKEHLLAQSERNINETAELLEGSVSTWLNERVDVMQGLSEILAQDSEVSKDDIYRILNSDNFNDLVSYYYGALDEVKKIVDIVEVDKEEIQKANNYLIKSFDNLKNPSV